MNKEITFETYKEVAELTYNNFIDILVEDFLKE